MRCLENIDTAMVGIPCGNHQSRSRIPNAPAAENCREFAPQQISVMLRGDDVLEATPRVAGEARQSAARLSKNVWAATDIEVKEITRGKTHRQSDRQNAARGRSCDQIEILSDGPVEILFQRRKKGRRLRSHDAAAVNRENSTNRRFI